MTTRANTACIPAAIAFEPNMPYEEYWMPVDGWKNAPHHVRGVDTYYAESVGTL